jgi:glucosamine-6-phosphate deaminase
MIYNIRLNTKGREVTMCRVTKEQLFLYCSIPAEELENHPERKIPFRLVQDSEEMGNLMARELVALIENNNSMNWKTRAIIPCGPSCWYEPFTALVNEKRVSLKNLVVFHMDECLDWQGRLLPKNHPYNFRSEMEKRFYNPVSDELAVEEENRNFCTPAGIDSLHEKIWSAPIDVTFGGWGQDGHIAYNQARRHPFSSITAEELKESGIRVQENNIDTIIALAQRTFGTAYQFVPPMSVTLGVKECLNAKKVRVFSDTGAWKQTALRVALFGPVTPEYPLTLLQEHPDALITATIATARHPISEHPEWDLGV